VFDVLVEEAVKKHFMGAGVWIRVASRPSRARRIFFYRLRNALEMKTRRTKPRAL